MDSGTEVREETKVLISTSRAHSQDSVFFQQSPSLKGDHLGMRSPSDRLCKTFKMIILARAQLVRAVEVILGQPLESMFLEEQVWGGTATSWMCTLLLMSKTKSTSDLGARLVGCFSMRNDSIVWGPQSWKGRGICDFYVSKGFTFIKIILQVFK